MTIKNVDKPLNILPKQKRTYILYNFCLQLYSICTFIDFFMQDFIYAENELAVKVLMYNVYIFHGKVQLINFQSQQSFWGTL